MRANSLSARSYDACAVCTSGTALTSNVPPSAQAESRLDLRGVGLGLGHLRLGLRGDRRTSAVPSATGVPRSTGVAMTRPAISAATSACSSAIRLPVARMKRAIGCSTAATGETATALGASGASLDLPAAASQPVVATAAVSVS